MLWIRRLTCSGQSLDSSQGSVSVIIGHQTRGNLRSKLNLLEGIIDHRLLSFLSMLTFLHCLRLSFFLSLSKKNSCSRLYQQTPITTSVGSNLGLLNPWSFLKFHSGCRCVCNTLCVRPAWIYFTVLYMEYSCAQMCITARFKVSIKLHLNMNVHA